MSEKITLPAGTYWVCDPCYAIPEGRWHEWLEITGLFKKGGDINLRILSGKLDGKMCLGIGTAYGDGVYYDQYGHEYGVDAGLIGLVPKEIADQGSGSSLERELLQVFPEDVECYFNEDTGEIVLGHIVIQTGDNPDDEGEEEDDEEEYDSAW